MAKSSERLWQALHEVQDPEFPISVVDMGLIYGLKEDNGTVAVELTFTSMGCPCTEFIITDIRERLLREPDVEQVQIEIVWDPPWSAERLSERGAAALEAYGVGA